MAIIEGRANNVVSLPCNIRRILGSTLPIGDKEQLIDNAFVNINFINLEDCSDLTTLAFSLILLDDKGSISTGWCILKNLEQTQQSGLIDVINIPLIESLITGSQISTNISEIPTIIKWCLKNGLAPILETTVRENILRFLHKAACKNDISTSALLSSTANLLEAYPNCIPTGSGEMSELSQVVIQKLARLCMPNEASLLSQFISNINGVERLLGLLADHASDRRQILAAYLKYLYSAVSDTVSCPNPCPALASILQVVDSELIHVSVQSILAEHSDSSSLIRLTMMLCTWLVIWPRACKLNRWTLALMSRLEEENRLDVLDVVSQQTVETLLNAMLLPAFRPGVQPVLSRMLMTPNLSPHIFHKVVPVIPFIIQQLRREESSSSRDALQCILNICAECMRMYPGYPQLYEPLVHLLESCWQEEGLAASPGYNSSTPLWQSVPVVPTRVGLHNLGNTCYMNSVLQALYMTHRFSNAILQSDASESVQPVLCTLQRLFVLLLHSRRPAVSAEDLLNLTRPPGFSPGHQQDSSEFLIYLLDVLHEQEKNQRVHILPEAGDGEGEAGPSTPRRSTHTPAAGGEAAIRIEEEEDDVDGAVDIRNPLPMLRSQAHHQDHLREVPNHGPETETIVRRIFGGELQIRIQCLACGFESSHTDPFIELQVCFPEEHAGLDAQPLELQSLLYTSLSPERLTGDNRYRCDHCRSLQEGVRILQVVEPPQYLILILKHFRYNPITKQRMKLMHKVHYTETLELPLISNPPNSARYLLYAAVVHSGRSVDAGHYYTYSRDAGGNWLRMDDETVTSSNSEELNSLRPPDTPYMLFYCGTSSSLQPTIGSPEQLTLADLRPPLARFVLSDNAAYLQEERHRNKVVGQSHSRNVEYRYRTDDDDDDDDNLPGSSCGGQINMNTPFNRFVF